MPAADITNVSVTFENGLKREEYGPTRKASVSITAAVDKGEDGVVAMNYISTLARAKVAEMLGLEVPAEVVAQIQPAQQIGDPVGEPAQRKRRTKEQIAADAAAAAGTGVSAGSGAGTQAGTAATGDATSEWEEPSPPTSAASPASDDWSADAALAAAPITDADLAMHCSKHAQRLGGGEKVKGVITSVKPAAWDKPKFGVTDIPPEGRPAFVVALEALT